MPHIKYFINRIISQYLYSGAVIAAEAPLGVLPVTVDLCGAAVVAVTPVVLGAAVAVPEGEDAGLAGVGPRLGDARLLAAFGRRVVNEISQ